MFKMQMNLFTAFLSKRNSNYNLHTIDFALRFTYLAEKEYGNLGMSSFFISPI